MPPTARRQAAERGRHRPKAPAALIGMRFQSRLCTRMRCGNGPATHMRASHRQDDRSTAMSPLAHGLGLATYKCMQMTFEGGGTAMRPVPIGGAVEAFKSGLAARKPVSEHNRQCRGLARLYCGTPGLGRHRRRDAVNAHSNLRPALQTLFDSLPADLEHLQHLWTDAYLTKAAVRSSSAGGCSSATKLSFSVLFSTATTYSI